MKTKKHVYSLLILESHLDTFGHMNHATYLQVLEEARWDLITANGYGLTEILKNQLGPVILEVNLKFRREVQLRQRVIIETQLISYQKRIATILQEIKDEQGQIHCIAELKFGLFDLKKRKLVLPTPQWLQAMGAADI